MSRVEMVRASFDAYRRGDFDALAEMVDPDVEVHDWPESADPRIFRGKEGFRQAGEVWGEAWEYMHGEPTGLVETKDQVFAFIRMTGKGRGSAIEMTVLSFNEVLCGDGRVGQPTQRAGPGYPNRRRRTGPATR